MICGGKHIRVNAAVLLFKICDKSDIETTTTKKPKVKRKKTENNLKICDMFKSISLEEVTKNENDLGLIEDQKKDDKNEESAKDTTKEKADK